MMKKTGSRKSRWTVHLSNLLLKLSWDFLLSSFIDYLSPYSFTEETIFFKFCESAKIYVYIKRLWPVFSFTHRCSAGLRSILLIAVPDSAESTKKHTMQEFARFSLWIKRQNRIEISRQLHIYVENRVTFEGFKIQSF